MDYGQEDYVWEARDKLVSSHFSIRKISHQDTGRSVGQDLNQEWYCSSKAIAQIMVVFAFHSHFCRWSCCWKRNPDFDQASGWLQATVLTNAYQANLKNLTLLNEKQANVFLTTSLMKQLLKSPNKSTLINDLIQNLAQKNENSRSVPCATSKFRKSCSTER